MKVYARRNLALCRSLPCFAGFSGGFADANDVATEQMSLTVEIVFFWGDEVEICGVLIERQLV